MASSRSRARGPREHHGRDAGQPGAATSLFATLSTASYSTASATGALSYMDYAEVKDVDAARRELRLAMGGVLTAQQFADVLLRRYERALKETK